MQNHASFPNHGLKIICAPPEFEPGCPFFPAHKEAPYLPSTGGINYLHYHNGLEIGYCYSGSGIFFIDNGVFSYHAPCASIIYKGQVHIAQSSSEEPSQWNFINIDNEEAFGDFKNSFHFGHGDAPIITPENNFNLFSLVKLFLDEVWCEAPTSYACATHLLKAIVYQHDRQRDDTKQIKPTMRWILEDIAPAVSYIGKYYDEDVTVEYLASLCNLSEATLRRKFNDCMGLSPIDYLHKVRISAAMSLLITENKTILEICHQVGYQSQSSFNRQFQKITGTSPMSIRKRK